MECYKRNMKEKPLLTKGLQMGARAGLADFITQRLATGPPLPYNALRTVQQAAYGMLVTGPLGHYWGKRLEQAYPGTREENVVAKTAVNNAVFLPATNALLLFTAGVLGNNPEDDKRRAERHQRRRQLLGLAAEADVDSDDEEGDSADHPTLVQRLNNGASRVQAKWKASIENGLKLNVPLDYVTFKYIPGDYRLLFKVFVSLANTTQTAWAAKKREVEEKRRKRRELNQGASGVAAAAAAPVKVELSKRAVRVHRRA